MQTLVGDASHGIAALAFLVLFLVLVGRWRTRVHAASLAGACALTSMWALAVLADVLPDLAETLRSAAWAVLLVLLLGPTRANAKRFMFAIGLICVATLVAPSLMVAIVARLMLALLGMLLIEQVYRGAPGRDRWGIKFACIGIGSLFSYDFFMYSDAALFGHINSEISAARGVVNALAVPLLAVSAARNPRWSSGVSVSRRVMLHSATLLGAALYLLAMATSAYYLRFVGGDWGRIMQLAFLCGACMVLVGVLFSGSVRARLNVLISKHFYTGRFDYREEWLRFTRVLSNCGPDLDERAIEALAGLVESPAGILWLRRESGAFDAVAGWNCALPQTQAASQDVFCEFLALRQWVVDVSECAQTPQRYGQLQLPLWLRDLPNIWLVVPMMLHARLFGFITLAQPRTPVSLDWEVTDLLKVAGTQAASYLAYRDSLASLMVARQFESLNRMSAFIVHDLKNLVFQLSLLLDNAAKFKDRPEFQADMLGTLENSVHKMKTMLQKLARNDAQDRAQVLRLDDVVRAVMQGYALATPRPQLALDAIGLCVSAQRARLERVIGHLVQNAIDATTSPGSVTVRLTRDSTGALVEVRDTGVGMSESFIRERLFKPFESSKANGMGIGLFEARDYVRELGGALTVSSAPGQGTVFCMHLPLAGTKESHDGKEKAADCRG